MSEPNWKNRTMWTGDNLEIMRGMNSESVDLIYLDPPFNSNRTYEAPIGSKAAGAAFKDTWTLSDLDMAWHGYLADKEPALYAAIDAAGHTHGKSMKSYLIMMGIRLVEMRRILKHNGSIYLHCDPTASHYLKMVMDSLFGARNFRNELIWHYGKWSNAARFFQRNHDTILFYTNSDEYPFNKQYTISPDKRRKLDIGYQVNRPGGVKQLLVYDRKRAANKIAEGNYDRVVYMDDEQGTMLHDVWDDINLINSQARERVGYPTQKPLALLDRIIRASTGGGASSWIRLPVAPRPAWPPRGWAASGSA